MSIQILKDKNQIILKTKRTTYAMEMMFGRFPVHLYYGKSSPKPELAITINHRSFSPYYEELGRDFCPDNNFMEFPFFGNGDYRATALRVRDLKTGCDVTDYTYRRAKKFKGRCDIPGIPCGDADEHTETLEMIFDDEVTQSELHLYYTLFPECDVISRYFTLINKGDHDLQIEKCMSLSLDLPASNWELLSFHGAHNAERQTQREPILHGVRRIASRRGASSHHSNPFIMVADRKTTEERGDAYGFNLVYSGSFLDEIEVDQNGTLRVMTGLGDENFSMLLTPGEQFTSPEAVMTYSDKGLGEASRNMHRFTRAHILPPEVFEKRPVVLNSWEAFHFNIDEKLMIDFAKGAKECGMDMLVMDDGWFGERHKDNAGLGDWTPNAQKFPRGLTSFVENVRAQGVKFGIWIEPEMVNPNSDLYRAHPEWAIQAPSREPLQSRHQLVLDMANPAVLDYLKTTYAKTFAGVHIDYFKWDMNRHMSNVYSNALPPERQKEASFRYMLGVYELFRWFRAQFPNAMIENCSGGGGRYDLAMMKYSTQIWASDNTHADHRTRIQYGSTFGYPTSVMSCHVANHKNSCEIPRRLEYSYRVALGGPLGYEFNVLAASEETKAAMKKQIEEYRTYEDLILGGDFYRLVSPIETDCYAHYFVSEDNARILLSFLQNVGDPKQKAYKLKISRAILNATYEDLRSCKLYSGAELRRGITVTADPEDEYAKMFYLVKKS